MISKLFLGGVGIGAGSAQKLVTIDTVRFTLDKIPSILAVKTKCLSFDWINGGNWQTAGQDVLWEVSLSSMLLLQTNLCHTCWTREISVIVRAVDAMLVYALLAEGVETRKVTWFGELLITELAAEELSGNDQLWLFHVHTGASLQQKVNHKHYLSIYTTLEQIKVTSLFIHLWNKIWRQTIKNSWSGLKNEYKTLELSTGKYLFLC